MKKAVILAELGHVVLGTYKEDGNIKLTNLKPMFKLGDKNSTIPNTMNSLAEILNKLSEGEEMYTVATLDLIVSKVYSDILVKEFLAQEQLSNKRRLSAPELQVYESLISAVGASYGKVLIQSERYITKTVKEGLTVEQLEWANLFTACHKSLKAKTTPAPQLVEIQVEEVEGEELAY